VPNRAKALGGLLAVVLAGCASDPHKSRARVPDWESEEVAAAAPGLPAVSAAPVQAPVATNPSPLTPAYQFNDAWVPLNRWCQANGLGAPLRIEAAPLSTYSLNTAGGALVLRARSLSAQWDGLEFRLGFAPQLIDGQLWVHSLDLEKTLQPMLGGAKMSFPAARPVIVVDPGHGGEDAGARSIVGHHYEKEFTLDWARRLAPLLASNGWQVFLTRTNDADLALSNRVAFADEHKASAFLSLHFNSAAPNEVEAGLETYCLTPAGMPSTVTRGFADDPSLVFPNNAFDAQNLQLALQVHRALLRVNGNHDRAVRRARFLGVLRGQQRAAILVEGGYLSNPLEARLISDPAYRQKLAEAVARALGEAEPQAAVPGEAAVSVPAR